MAAAAAAALLDELMGRNRNVLPNEKPKELNWEDPEVSSFYLASALARLFPPKYQDQSALLVNKCILCVM
jgi:hypothetical protein